MQNKQNRNLTLIMIILFYTAFWAVWCVREVWLRPIMAASLGEWEFEVCETILKLIVWTLPAAFCVWHYKNDVLLSWREMWTTKVKWLKYSLVLIGFIAYNVIAVFIMNGKLTVSPDFRISSLVSAVLFVGITEEVVFRGFFLNTLLEKLKPWYAVLLTAVLFLLIHFPIWIYKGILLSTILSGGFLLIMLLSVIFSWTFIKSKNIFVPIMLHMSWNLLVTLLFG